MARKPKTAVQVEDILEDEIEVAEADPNAPITVILEGNGFLDFCLNGKEQQIPRGVPTGVHPDVYAILKNGGYIEKEL